MQAIVERTVSGMGYEPVDIERAQHGVLRVFIDSPQGIRIEDCEQVSRQLSHVLAVEDIDYARLEVSSPGLDRPLKKAADYERFVGARVALRLRLAFQGRRNYEGVLMQEPDGKFALDLIEAAPAQPARRGARKAAAGKARAGKAEASSTKAATQDGGLEEAVARRLVFSLDEVERARLVPDYGSRRPE